MGFEDFPVKNESGKEKPRTKEDAQQELGEKFGMEKTSDFTQALQNGEIEKCKEWLQYILDNINNFPQYKDNRRWVEDREKEIEMYDELKASGKLENFKPRKKEDARKELFEKFGIRDTAGFRNVLADGKIELAREWLQYIVGHKNDFPQYLPNWDNWLRDRQKEIENAEK